MLGCARQTQSKELSRAWALAALDDGGHAAGVEREAFIAWSVGDPLYADDVEEIGERWDSLKGDRGITAETLFREARLDELNDWLDGHDDGPWHATHTWKVPNKGEGGDQAAEAGGGRQPETLSAEPTTSSEK